MTSRRAMFRNKIVMVWNLTSDVLSCLKICDWKHLHWTCTNPAKNVQPLAAVVVFVNPGARWRLANTNSGQHVEATVVIGNIEALLNLSHDPRRSRCLASSEPLSRIYQIVLDLFSCLTNVHVYSQIPFMVLMVPFTCICILPLTVMRLLIYVN